MKISNPNIYLLISIIFLIINSVNAQVKTPDGQNIEIEELDAFIKSQMKLHNVPGLSFAVINNSKLVYKQVYGLKNIETIEVVNERTIFETASVSKSIFAYFAMIMVEKGLIDLDTPLYKYMPYPDIEHDERYKLITARMVLSHTSGLPNWRFYNDDGKLNIKFTPGSQFHYSGEGYEFLAKVLTHLNNTDYIGLEKIIADEVYKPLKMTNSGFMLPEEQLKTKKASGYEDGELSDGIPADMTKPYFGSSFKFHTDVIDFSKFMIALIKEKGMKKETFTEMFRQQVVLPEDESLRTEDGFDSWSLGFIRAETSQGMKLAHGGMNPSFQCYYMILKEKEFGFVFFGNSNTAIEMFPVIEEYLLSGKKE